MTGFGKKKEKDLNGSKIKSNSILEDAINYQIAGNYLESEKLYRILIKNGYKDSRILNNYGLICKKLNRAEESKQLFQEAINLYPDKPEAFCNLANNLCEEGDYVKAEEYARKAIQIKPILINSLLILSNIMLRQGKNDEALSYLQRVHNINPNSFGANINLGALLQERGDLKEAADCFRKATIIEPRNSMALRNLGGVLKDLNEIEKAESMLKKAISIDPKSAINYIHLSSILLEKLKLNEAEQMVRHAIKIDPSIAESYLCLGKILLNKGKTIEGRKSLYKSIDLNSNLANSYYHISTISHIEIESKLRENLFSEDMLLEQNPKHKIDIYFARANVFNQDNDLDNECNMLSKANILTREIFKSNYISYLQRIQDYYEKSLLIEKKHTSNSDKDCIFIVGLPRSGKTLVESILSCNQKLFTAGENIFLSQAINEYMKNYDKKNTKSLEELFLSNFVYLEEKISFICSTTPSNFIYAGLISKLMPNSKIIYCYRSILDNILEIYSSNLQNKYTFKTCLEESAKFALQLNKQMKIYKQLFPESIYFLNYDSLVINPKDEILSLINWLNWKYNNDYLSPKLDFSTTGQYGNDRDFINSTKVGRWKKYQTLLKPAIELITKDK